MVLPCKSLLVEVGIQKAHAVFDFFVKWWKEGYLNLDGQLSYQEWMGRWCFRCMCVLLCYTQDGLVILGVFFCIHLVFFLWMKSHTKKLFVLCSNCFPYSNCHRTKLCYHGCYWIPIHLCICHQLSFRAQSPNPSYCAQCSTAQWVLGTHVNVTAKLCCYRWC